MYVGKSVLILMIRHFVSSARIYNLAHAFNFKPESFLNKRIQLVVALSMLDSALADLGVNTIGYRIRLGELYTKYVWLIKDEDNEDDENAAATCTTMSYSDSVRQEMSLLFQPSSTSGRSSNSGRWRKRNKSCPQRTTFVCLASRFAR